MKKFVADFETATWLDNETYVWAWAVCEIGSEQNISFGNSIDTFLGFCEKNKNSKFYFHNGKFDFEFIIWWLLKNGFEHIEEKTDIKEKSFSTLISDLGQYYQLIIYLDETKKGFNKITFLDSLKVIPIPVKKIPEAFNIEEKKLEIDYNIIREKNHELTKEEKEYIAHDVIIVSKALNQLFNENLTKMTIGSNAINDFKNIIKKSKFENLFPNIPKDLDQELRLAYKGGFTYLNELYKEKIVENIVNLDVNSLYPYVLSEKLLPFGEPVFYEGKYINDDIYPLYIQCISCSFELKKNKIPTIQIKNNRFEYRSNEYLKSSNGKIEVLVLTNIDLKLFLEHYETNEIIYECGWKFKAKTGIFKDYINKWGEIKIQASMEDNEGKRSIAKLMLNSLYGKFATSLYSKSKIPYLGNDDIVHYYITEEKEKNGLYLPIRNIYYFICKRNYNKNSTANYRLFY